ncbi:MAG: hypothetical protein II152_04955 [Succinivibrionaceae bacterium]|nr:hypothetical protein [Succinivibrionaceae bacterium]
MKQHAKRQKSKMVRLQRPKATKYPCPVCGKHIFPGTGTFDICPECGWENDGMQGNDPDYQGGANELSLNDYRKGPGCCLGKIRHTGGLSTGMHLIRNDALWSRGCHWAASDA